MSGSLIKEKRWYYLFLLFVPAFLASAQEEVYLGTVRVGSISGTVDVPLVSNVQQLDLQAAATDLYKGNDPASLHKIPLTDAGAQITCELGSPVGGTGLLPWLTTPPPDILPVNWTGAVSETGAFDSRQPGIFNQLVSVMVQWDQSDPVLPRGVYAGWIGLVAYTIPPSGQAQILIPVHLDVLSMIAVGATQSLVVLDPFSPPGQISGQVAFRIDSNLQTADLQVSCTDLYRDGLPASTQAIPVTGLGAAVEPDTGYESMAGGSDNFLEWAADWTRPDGLMGRATVVSSFESGQAGHFSQDVTVRVLWNATEAQLAPGEYVAYIRLVGSGESAPTSEAEIQVRVLVGSRPPVAETDGDHTVAVGETVTLDGGASSDPDGDALTYAWSLVSAPAGSASVISNSMAAQATFVPDLPGSYVARLVVNDGTQNSEPVFVTITVLGRKQAVRDTLDKTQTDIAALPAAALRNSNSAVVLGTKIDATLALVENDQYRGALNKLKNDILKKTDGCALRGDPDKNDWIITCDAQAQVYPQMQRAIELLRRLLEE